METINIQGSISTFTGRLFRPLEPDVEDINLLDICHSLSNQCRFTGHTREFYSVAEHSCRVHDILPKELKLAGLLHDASEAYLSDIAKPIKVLEELDIYREIEDKIMEKMALKYNFDYPFAKEIKTADSILLVTEYRDLMMTNKYIEADLPPVFPDAARIIPWTPVVAKSAMMERLQKLGIEVNK